jgi:DNA processing protein
MLEVAGFAERREGMWRIVRAGGGRAAKMPRLV